MPLKVKLTGRDMKFFEKLDSYGLLSSNQIISLMFDKIDEATALRRLRKLREKNYLQSHTGLQQGQLVWTLTKKATDLIAANTEVSINKNTLEHDIFVSAVRVRLEQNNIGESWLSGHYLKQRSLVNQSPYDSKSPQIPDSIFTLQTTTGPKAVALEVELIRKSKRRYKEIFENYSNLTSVNLVWYVVASNRLGQLLSELADSFTREGGTAWFYWSNLNDTISNDKPVILNSKEKSITLLKPALADALGHSNLTAAFSKSAILSP